MASTPSTPLWPQNRLGFRVWGFRAFRRTQFGVRGMLEPLWVLRLFGLVLKFFFEVSGFWVSDLGSCVSGCMKARQAWLRAG